MVFWFTGLSGAGKTTLSTWLADYLRGQGRPVLLMDGDVARASLCEDLGFSQDDRRENVRRLADCAGLAEKSGIIACVACISPLEEQRRLAVERLDDCRIIYLDCPLGACEARDPKGHYKKARANCLPNFTGIAQKFEPPQKPDLVLDTADCDFEDCVAKLKEFADSALAKDA